MLCSMSKRTTEAPQEELEEVFLPVVEPILNLFQVHWKVIFRDTSLIAENVFGK
jgi:hypothetical protein